MTAFDAALDLYRKHVTVYARAVFAGDEAQARELADVVEDMRKLVRTIYEADRKPVEFPHL